MPAGLASNEMGWYLRSEWQGGEKRQGTGTGCGKSMVCTFSGRKELADFAGTIMQDAHCGSRA